MKKVKYNLLINIFTIALVLLNLIGFLIHSSAFPENSTAVNAWNYFNSSMFKFVTGTLTFPIIIMLLESKFKIIEAAREKRQQEIEAIQRNQVNKRKEIRANIDSDWNKLYEYVNQLQYFVVNPKDNFDNLKRLSDIQIGLINSVVDWDRNVNELYYYYPRLKDLEPVYLYCLNLYVLLTSAMITYMKKNINDVSHITKLQEAYEVITGTAKNLWYGDFINIIRLKIQRIEVLDIDVEEVKSIDTQIESHISRLKGNAKFLMDIDLATNNVFKDIKSNSSETFQNLMSEYKTHIKEQEVNNLYTFKKWTELENEYYKTERSEMMEKLILYYSEESIFQMAQQIGAFSFLVRLAQPIQDAKVME